MGILPLNFWLEKACFWRIHNGSVHRRDTTRHYYDYILRFDLDMVLMTGLFSFSIQYYHCETLEDE